MPPLTLPPFKCRFCPSVILVAFDVNLPVAFDTPTKVMPLSEVLNSDRLCAFRFSIVCAFSPHNIVVCGLDTVYRSAFVRVKSPPSSKLPPDKLRESLLFAVAVKFPPTLSDALDAFSCILHTAFWVRLPPMRIVPLIINVIQCILSLMYTQCLPSTVAFPAISNTAFWVTSKELCNVPGYVLLWCLAEK